MADNNFLTSKLLPIADENSSLPSSMSEFLGAAGEKYIKRQEFSKYQSAKNLSLFMAEGDDPVTFVRLHWYWERPIMERVYTGSERGRQWNDKQVGIEHIDYPDAFDDVIWEYAQIERDAAEKDVIAYATWYASKIEYISDVKIPTPIPFPTFTYADSSKPPSKTVSAEKAAEFKKKLLETLKGNANESLLSVWVNYIINKTRADSRKVGREKAKTNSCCRGSNENSKN